MLAEVKTKKQNIEKYKEIISKSLFSEIKESAKKLKGLKVIHINSTPRGGGVAEVLKSLVPLMREAGLKASWHTIPPREEFFEITKKIHNALQGKKCVLSLKEKRNYLNHIKEISNLLKRMHADAWVIHDPQPLALVNFLESKPALRISRIHLDSSNPNPQVWSFMEEFLLKYDKVIFSTKDFVQNGLPKEKITVFQPAIDPFTEKNNFLSAKNAKEILEGFGISSRKPLMAQVSRFDPFKDPLGAVESYRLAKKKIPSLQFALVGLFLAHDDPEAMRVFKKVEKETKGDPDIFLFSNPDHLGSLRVDTFVNACQSASDIIIQKSIKEGFGLVVTEAMWKEKAVIGGKAGGIKLQIKNGKNGFLVSSPKEAAKRAVQLLKDENLRKKLGREAKKTVKQEFLMPRLLRDYLKLFLDLH